MKSLSLISAVIFFFTAGLIKNLSANAGIMLYEPSPLTAALGKSHDLLNIKSPLTRTYSGMYSLKDKTELTYYHSILPNDVAIETAYLGLKYDFIPGIRLGAYMTYLDLGGFNSLDSRGRLLSRYDVNDIMIGLPVVFNVKSTRIPEPAIASGSGEKPGALHRILYALNGALNFNFHQTTLGEYKAMTFFGDANLCARFKPGYIGMPRSVMDFSEIEKNMKSSQLRYRGEKNDLLKKNNLPESSVSNLDAYNVYYDNQYIKRSNDMENVFLRKAQILSVYNDQMAILPPVGIDDAYATGLAEISNLAETARSEAASHYRYARINLVSELDANEESISNLTAKFSEYAQTNEAALIPARELFDLTKKYLIAQYKGIVIEVVLFSLELKEKELAETRYTEYKIKNNRKTGKPETLGDIALSVYSNAGYASYLQIFNAFDAKKNFKEGEIIKIPESNYPPEYIKLTNKRTRLENMKKEYDEENREYVDYIVKDNDTWKSIAATGIKTDMVASYKKLSKKEALVPGQVLRIPSESKKVRREQREKEYLSQKNIILKKLAKIPMNSLSRHYFNAVMQKSDKRTGLFEYHTVLEKNLQDKNHSLNSIIARQKARFDKKAAALKKNLRRITLKRELDFLGRAGRRDKKESTELTGEEKKAVVDYKRKERDIYRSLLRDIYLAKKELIGEFTAEEKSQQGHAAATINELYEKKEESARENFMLKQFEQGEKISKEISSIFAEDLKIMQMEKQADVFLLGKKHIDKNSELAWEEYITELVYLSSEEKRDTMALGAYIKNIGMPVKYRTVSEDLPIAFGADFNYEFMHMPNHGLVFYLHYGNSELEGHSPGAGLMYKLLNIFEFRGGASYEHKMITPGAALSAAFNIGLMDYRLDGGLRYNREFGFIYSFGLTVMF